MVENNPSGRENIPKSNLDSGKGSSGYSTFIKIGMAYETWNPMVAIQVILLKATEFTNGSRRSSESKNQTMMIAMSGDLK